MIIENKKRTQKPKTKCFAYLSYANKEEIKTKLKVTCNKESKHQEGNK